MCSSDLGVPLGGQNGSSTTVVLSETSTVTGGGFANPGVTSTPSGAASTASSSGASSHSDLAAIIGGVVGGVALLALAFIVFALRRKHRSRDGASSHPDRAAGPQRLTPRVRADIHPFVSMPDSAGAEGRTDSPGYGYSPGGIPYKARQAMEMRMQMAAEVAPVSAQLSQHANASDDVHGHAQPNLLPHDDTLAL